MGEQEKKKRIELEQDMSWKMYQILTITACTANLIGTICNFCIHGTKLPTILCGICLLMIVTIGIIGWTTKKVQVPAALIILILVWFEFPYLYYCYGDASIVYLILGVVGLAIFFPRNVVIVSFAVTLLEYLVIMMSSFERPSVWRNMDEAGKIGTTLGSFVIVGVSVFAMIFELLRSYEEQRKQLLSLSEDLNFAANHDPLTRLYNRRYLVNQVNEWICKPEKSFWIVLMDVDEFKAVNDTYGHDAGDEVLKAVAELFMDKMKTYGRVCRWGGEEFLFVFYGRNGDAAYDVLQEIYDEIHRLTVSYENEEIRITMTFGLEEYDKNDGMEMAIRRADEKLYQGKETGRDKIVY